jgi:uncharacterized membrane protein YvlD (DUF360 family)
MRIVNDVVAIPIEFVLAPFRAWPPLVGLTLLSIIVGAGALFVVDRTSPHARVSAVKRSLLAALLEIVIFNHDLKAIAKAQLEILKLNLVFLRLSVVPLILTSVPILMLMAHLQGYYGYAGLRPGQFALMTVDLAPEDRRPQLSVEAPDGVRIDSPVVWIPSLGQAICRILPIRDGEYRLTLRLGEETFTKTIVASNDWISRSPARVPAGFDSVLYPAEAPLPRNAMIRRITIHYPERSIDFAGWQVHWTWLFLSLSIGFSFLLKAMGVCTYYALQSRR